MSDIEFECCEHCSKVFLLKTMRMMEDCWFCESCTNEFKKAFDTCKHKWSPHTDVMGDPGQYCEHCSGFVRDEDFPRLFPCMTMLAQVDGILYPKVET